MVVRSLQYEGRLEQGVEDDVVIGVVFERSKIIHCSLHTVMRIGPCDLCRRDAVG
jgi:hypothetical protein